MRRVGITQPLENHPSNVRGSCLADRMRELTGKSESFADSYVGAVGIAEEPQSPSPVGQTGDTGVLPVDIGLSGVLLRIVDGRALLKMMERFGELTEARQT